MKWNIFFLNKIYKTRKLINYLIFMIRKYKESKIVKKCLRWINLLVVSRGKCNNGIKRENSTKSSRIKSVKVYFIFLLFYNFF